LSLKISSGCRVRPGRTITAPGPVTDTERTDWWNHVTGLPEPRVVIMQDIDSDPGAGAFLSEVHVSILQAMGCAGAVTNGAARDIPAIEKTGFQVFAGRLTFSRAYIRIVEFGTPVKVGGLTIQPGELIHGDRHGNGLPFVLFLSHLAMATLIACILTAVFVYLVEGGVTITPRGPRVSRVASAHLMILGGLFFVLMAWSCRLSMYDLLYSPRGTVFGAGYTDIAATLPVLKLLLVLCLLTALAMIFGGLQNRWKPALLSFGALILVWIVGGSIYPEIIQRFIVAPNELDKERPYIARSIEFTRKAYALDRFDEREFSATENYRWPIIAKTTPPCATCACGITIR